MTSHIDADSLFSDNPQEFDLVDGRTWTDELIATTGATWHPDRSMGMIFNHTADQWEPMSGEWHLVKPDGTDLTLLSDALVAAIGARQAQRQAERETSDSLFG